jgi:hypothetical protein
MGCHCDSRRGRSCSLFTFRSELYPPIWRALSWFLMWRHAEPQPLNSKADEILNKEGRRANQLQQVKKAILRVVERQAPLPGSVWAVRGPPFAKPEQWPGW